MIKNFILMILIILCIPIINGLEDGDILSQQTLNSINFDTVNYNNLQCKSENYVILRNNNIIHYHSCLNLKPLNYTHYIVYRDYMTINIPLWLIFQCVDVYGMEICKSNYKDFLILNYIQPSFNNIKNNAKSYQTTPIEEPYYFWLKNIELY